MFVSADKELNKSEYERLLRAAKNKKNEKLYLIMQTICSTGIRVSELKFITVESVKSGQAQVKLKGKVRPVFLPDELVKLLKRYVGEQEIESGSVFVTRTGKPIDRHGIWKAIGSFVRRADMILLSLCIAASVFGIVVISSATNVKGSAQYVRTQILALVLGIILYVFFTLVDVDIIAERRELLLIFSAIFILLLFPFGDTRSGNRSWLAFSFLPFSIQPAEICKIPFIMILAKTMSIRQNKISHISTVLRLAVITVFMFGLIVVASEDLGVALQYLFIFVIMAFVGGVSLLWFLGAFAVLLVASPFLWQFLSYDRRSRIWVLFDPRIDPAAQDQRYQMNRSLRALQNGGITGQGLYHGTMVQSGTIPAQHTDLIFSSIGEELGMLGCMAVLILLTAIIIRIIYVGIKSGNYMNRLICIGIAGMLTAQVFINIGVCIGLVPVIGLTLPFFSYGGSSLVTMFFAMGIVSGINMRPAPDSSARYIRPPLSA